MNSNIPTHYTVNLAGVTRTLPVCPLPDVPHVHIAYLDVSSDVELTKACAYALTKLIPAYVTVVVSPYGKALPLYQRVLELTGLPGITCPKRRTVNMRSGCLSTKAVSVTTPDKHDFFLSAEGIALVQGQEVVIIDDLVSEGGTMNALKTLLGPDGAKARSVTVVAIGVEGADRTDVRFLQKFPVWKDDSAR